MANTIRVKRRVTGNAGAPAALKSGELAWNMADDTVYGGYGDDGSGNATSVKAIAGDGTFATRAWVVTQIGAAGGGDMTKAVYDTNNDGKVDAAATADSVAWGGVTGKPTAFTPSTHNHPTSEITNLDTLLAAKAALASPALTGTPTAPTATAGTDTTQIATTAFVKAAVDALINGAPGALDTIKELADALGSDANFSTTVTNGLAAKLAKASNLSDLVDKAASRTNLGLGTIATQNADAVAITGGAIDGITLDGGVF